MRKKIIKDMGILFSGNFISKIIAFLLSIIIARYLGDSLFGIFSFAIAFTSIFGLISDFGMKVLIRREIARDTKTSNKYFIDASVAKILLSSISLTIIFILVKLLNYSFQKEIAIYMAALCTIVLSFTENIKGIFQAHSRMGYGAYLAIARNIIRFILTYSLLVKGYSLLTVLIVMLIVRLLELIASYLILHFKIEKIKLDINFERSKKLMLRALPFGFSSLFILIYYQIDIIMLSFMVGDQVVGWYSAAYNLIAGLLFIPLAFTTAITPLASQLFLKSRDRMKSLCLNSLKYMAMVSFPIAIVVFILADKIISLIYGAKYVSSGLALAILIWSIIPTFVHYVLGLFVVSTNNERQGMINTGSCAILNVILNLILIPLYGLVGAAIATIFTELFLVTMNYRVLRKVFVQFNILPQIYKPLIASIIMSSIFFIRNWNLFIVIVIGAIIYLLVLFLIGGISSEDKELLISLFNRKQNETNPHP